MGKYRIWVFASERGRSAWGCHDLRPVGPQWQIFALVTGFPDIEHAGAAHRQAGGEAVRHIVRVPARDTAARRIQHMNAIAGVAGGRLKAVAADLALSGMVFVDLGERGGLSSAAARRPTLPEKQGHNANYNSAAQ